MNFYWVYDMPNWAFALLCVSFFISISVLGLLLFRKVITTRVIPQAHNDIVSFFSSGMNAIYGITLGLIAVGAWENFKEIDDNVSHEAASLGSLYQNIESLPSPLKDSLQSQLIGYTRYTIKNAWPEQQQGIIPMGGTARLSKFHKTLATFTPKTKGEEIILEESFKQLNHVFEYRRIRLQSITAGLPSAIWYVIFFGAILNIIITWFYVTDKFRVHVLMVMMFAALLGSLIFLVAAMDNPFKGEFSVSAEAFEIILKNMLEK